MSNLRSRAVLTNFSHKAHLLTIIGSCEGYFALPPQFWTPWGIDTFVNYPKTFLNEPTLASILFIFHLFIVQYSNSVHRRRRQERWPLYHYHGPSTQKLRILWRARIAKKEQLLFSDLSRRPQVLAESSLEKSFLRIDQFGQGGSFFCLQRKFPDSLNSFINLAAASLSKSLLIGIKITWLGNMKELFSASLLHSALRFSSLHRDQSNRLES